MAYETKRKPKQRPKATPVPSSIKGAPVPRAERRMDPVADAPVIRRGSCDAVIIGGGAAGLAAAITLAERLRDAGCKVGAGRIVVLEKMDEPGRKILATGNGRCNLSNAACVDVEETLAFFRRLGVLTRTDEAGRIYPYSEEAKSVRDALVRRAEELGVEIRTECKVEEIRPSEDDKAPFAILYSNNTSKKTVKKAPAGKSGSDPAGKQAGRSAGRNGKYAGDRRYAAAAPANCAAPTECGSRVELLAAEVLLAPGAKAGPAFGTSGAGPTFARSLGHTVTRLAPALTAVETKEDVSACAGARAKTRLTLWHAGEQRGEWCGECQFTSYGISGICVFDLSGEMRLPEGKNLAEGFDDYTIGIDFLPEVESVAAADKLLGELFGARIRKEDLATIVKSKLADYLLRSYPQGVTPWQAAKLLKSFTVSPKGLRGWDMAQVTRGGVVLDEVDPETGASKVLPGLFLAGELLDYNGPCGGFNLNHAWITGMRAGNGMAERFLK